MINFLIPNSGFMGYLTFLSMFLSMLLTFHIKPAHSVLPTSTAPDTLPATSDEPIAV